VGPIRRLRRLTAADRSLLFQTVVLLGATRLGLWVLPLRVVRRLLARAARPPRGSQTVPSSRERIPWAVSVAQRIVPRATCLVQALAAEALFARYGHPADLRIGVLKTDSGALVAHAWVESAGRVVVGELLGSPPQPPYTPLPPLPGARI